MSSFSFLCDRQHTALMKPRRRRVHQGLPFASSKRLDLTLLCDNLVSMQVLFASPRFLDSSAMAVGTSSTFPATTTPVPELGVALSPHTSRSQKLRQMQGGSRQHPGKKPKKVEKNPQTSLVITGRQTEERCELALLCLSLSGTFPKG